MRITRVKRQFDKDDHEQDIKRYAKELVYIFSQWLKRSAGRGMSVTVLVDELDDCAKRYYERAYMKGKRQAFPAATLTVHDELKLRKCEAENKRYLQTHLTSAILRKYHEEELDDDKDAFIPTLSHSFTARIANMYGGHLWSITEEGFAAGIREVRQRMYAKLAHHARPEHGF